VLDGTVGTRFRASVEIRHLLHGSCEQLPSNAIEDR